MLALAIAAAVLAATVGPPWAQPCQPAEVETFAPVCASEDGNGCHWPAGDAGNGRGRSFYATAEGFVIYLDTLPACTDGPSLPCLTPAGSDGAWPYIATADGRRIYLETR